MCILMIPTKLQNLFYLPITFKVPSIASTYLLSTTCKRFCVHIFYGDIYGVTMEGVINRSTT